jgi:hypothetical protein
MAQNTKEDKYNKWAQSRHPGSFITILAAMET